MNIKWPFYFSLTFWPFIFFSTEHYNDPAVHQHEMVHYRRQRWIVLWWVLKYEISKKFRFMEECEAYKTEIEYKVTNNIQFSYDQYINNLLWSGYRNMCSRDEATTFINTIRRSYENQTIKENLGRDVESS